ncbi:CG13796 [Drosophila busckii]|uniref:CG13796 n=1 Tax=Drosophila busckii TaxID=30019 RepID=A0A0M4E306_DROBS|nr:CG13796 [Drosophila busckii]ALC40104.1 CG13796 [Drosophila busckii]
MKGICGDAKQQLNQCMLLGDTVSVSGNEASPAHGTRSTFRARQVHSMAIRNTSSYDTMDRPFRPDSLRGRWAKSADFYFASSSYAFNSMVFSDVAVWGLLYGGWTFYLSTYLLAVLFYSLPIFLIQTFLGQFSSSGGISAFRVSPIFKGLGYAILLLNLGTLSYYSINAAVPLIYTAHSLTQTLPWMSCNNTWNTPDCSEHSSYDVNAICLFFSAVIGSVRDGASQWTISMPMLLAIACIWLIVLALLLTKISIIGKALRCACVLMFGCFVAVFVYLVIHEDVGLESLLDYLHPVIDDSWTAIRSSIGIAILQANMVLGPGWGSILTLGSYNSFRSDAERQTYWVAISHVLINVMGTVCGHVVNDHFELHVGMFHVEKKHSMQFLYTAYGYLFGSFSTLPRLWCFLFFSVIFLAEVCALVIQLLSVLTALFDEFEQLRPRKRPTTILLVLCLMLSSIYFCTQMGFAQVSALCYVTLFTHIVISLLLIVMTTWIYGRVRFQCDLQFMLGKTISSLKIFIIRFIAPLFAVLCLAQITYLLLINGGKDTHIWVSQSLIYVLVSGYMIYKLCQTSGKWRQRMRQCFAPHDWHPVNADNRRFYEEIMGTSEMLVIDNGHPA